MTVLESIRGQFGAWDSVHGFGDADGGGSASENVVVVALMNAFHPEEVQRVFDAAVSRGWVESDGGGTGILYLTGQAREPGLLAAMDKGMRVVCVGHRVCEEWGVRYLAAEIRREFSGLDVVEVFEPEEPLPPRPKKEKLQHVGKKRKVDDAGAGQSVAPA